VSTPEGWVPTVKGEPKIVVSAPFVPLMVNAPTSLSAALGT
jgi:hypothetical protein